MSYNLFLDDERQPVDVTEFCHYSMEQVYRELHWVIVRSYDAFVDCINKRGLPNQISFDHDLGVIYPDVPHEELITRPLIKMETGTYRQGTLEEKTGLDCAKWLSDYCIDNKLKLPLIIIHSRNPTGAKNIEKFLLNHKKHND